jgi:hypothetical protein
MYASGLGDALEMDASGFGNAIEDTLGEALGIMVALEEVATAVVDALGILDTLDKASSDVVDVFEEDAAGAIARSVVGVIGRTKLNLPIPLIMTVLPRLSMPVWCLT